MRNPMCFRRDFFLRLILLRRYPIVHPFLSVVLVIAHPDVRLARDAKVPVGEAAEA